MPLIDRFRLDDVYETKWKCPLCNRLLPTMNAVVGHLMLDHTSPNGNLEEDLAWAKLMAESAEPVWVPRKQRYE